MRILLRVRQCIPVSRSMLRWAANLDIPERFPAGGLDHKRKVDEITRLAKKHAGAAERFANVAIEMSKA